MYLVIPFISAISQAMHRVVFKSNSDGSIETTEFESALPPSTPIRSWHEECLASRAPLSSSDSLYEEVEDMLSISQRRLHSLKIISNDNVRSAQLLVKEADELSHKISRRYNDTGLLEEIGALHELAKNVKRLLEEATPPCAPKKKRIVKKRRPVIPRPTGLVFDEDDDAVRRAFEE